MKIHIVTPAPPGSRKGNRVTALRWSRILRSLGHRVSIEERYDGGGCDVIIALHARRSADSVRRFARDVPGAPIIVALTGTDLYRDIRRSSSAKRSLQVARRLIVLQPRAIESLPRRLRAKTRVVFQSVPRPLTTVPKRKGVFEVCVSGHLRPVKDPFRTARAARLLPPDSRIEVTHVGQALSDTMHRQARDEIARNPRYRWLREQPRWRAVRILARSRLLVISSKLEGGANVLSEAIAADVPVISSRIDGSVGILGHDYPGYFPVGDTRALAALLSRCETDARFLRGLDTRCRRLAPLIAPSREKRSWAEIIHELRPERGCDAEISRAR